MFIVTHCMYCPRLLRGYNISINNRNLVHTMKVHNMYLSNPSQLLLYDDDCDGYVDDCADFLEQYDYENHILLLHFRT